MRRPKPRKQRPMQHESHIEEASHPSVFSDGKRVRERRHAYCPWMIFRCMRRTSEAESGVPASFVQLRKLGTEDSKDVSSESKSIMVSKLLQWLSSAFVSSPLDLLLHGW